MMPMLANMGCVGFIAWLLIRDVRLRGDNSVGSWLALLWVAILASRPITSWFMGGGGSSDGAAASYDAGNSLEGVFSLGMMFVGGLVLRRRAVSWSVFWERNRVLVIFYLFWLASAFLWAEPPLVSFRRWIKDVGNVLIVLVVLTEDRPVDAVKTLFRRCAYVLVPLSLLFILYYSEIGRTYHVWSGEMMFVGVTTHKNMLGGLLFVCGVFLSWDCWDRWRATEEGERDWLERGGLALILAITGFLMLKARSATSLACGVAGGGMFLAAQIPFVRNWLRHLGVVGIVGVFIVVSVSAVIDLPRLIIEALGRDMTLTTRTSVWPILLEHQSDPVLGAGFNSFWSGKRLGILWEQFGIIQAHNGYLETYLNGGLVAVVLLGVLLVGAGWRIKQSLGEDDDWACVRLIFWGLVIVHNFTEASFFKMALLWFVFLLVIVEYPAPAEEIEEESAELEPMENQW